VHGTDDALCDIAAWELAMQVDGNDRNKWKYESAYWTNDEMVDSGKSKKTKFFLEPANKIKIVSEDGNSIRWGHNQGKSLKELFGGSALSSSSAISKTEWRNWIPNAGWQHHCNAQGFNRAPNNNRKVRFGIVMNKANQCTSSDSSIGIGLRHGCAAGAECGCCSNGGQCNNKCKVVKVYVGGFGDPEMRWDRKKAAPGTHVSSDGMTWTQGSGKSWQGVMGDTPMCANGEGKYRWTVTIVHGRHHQIGVAKSNWDGKGSQHSNNNRPYAFLYSHHNGWTRHRGAGRPLGAPSQSTWWRGTWDNTEKGRKVTVSLDCEEHAFEVRTEKQWLGKMTYPSSWKAVYAAAAGQSSDHVYKIGHFRKLKGVHGCGMHDGDGCVGVMLMADASAMLHMQCERLTCRVLCGSW